MSTRSPRDVIADAIRSTEDPQNRHIIISCAHTLRNRRIIAGSVVEALALAGYSVVPTEVWERLSEAQEITQEGTI